MDEPPQRSLARPSLVAVAAGTAAEETAGISILSAVAAPAAAPPRSGPDLLYRRLPLLGLAMLVLIAAAFWSEWRQQAAVTASVDGAIPMPIQGRPQTMPAATAARAASEPAAAAATIELEPPSPAAAPSPGLAGLLEAAPTQAATTTAKAAPRQPPLKPQRSPFTAIEKPVAVSKPPKPVSPPATSNATDVDLLAALLTHGGTQAASVNAPKLTKPSARPKLSTTLSRLEPQPSTRERLSLCQQMAVTEMSRCRARVCAGLWGRDSACPAGDEPPARGAAAG